MKKIISFAILLSVMCCSPVAHPQTAVEEDSGFVILDVLLYRPLGFVATIIGTGFFIGLSPLTAFASIPEPHDAFAKTGKILILAPGAYTFVRRVGDRSFPYHMPQYKHKPVATPKKAVTPTQRPVTPATPSVQSPRGYPDTGKGL